jgi:hypothetical protein
MLKILLYLWHEGTGFVCALQSIQFQLTVVSPECADEWFIIMRLSNPETTVPHAQLTPSEFRRQFGHRRCRTKHHSTSKRRDNPFTFADASLNVHKTQPAERVLSK